MGDREPVALRREGEAARGRRRLVGLGTALGVECRDALPGREGDAPIGMERERVHPGAARLGEHSGRPVRPGLDDAAVVAGRHEALRIGRGGQDRA